MNTIPISATGGQGLSPRRILWYNMPRASMPDGKRCKKSLGLELSHRASSLYAYGITEVRRNALAFLGNAAFKYRLRTAWGSVHGILCPGPLCLRTYHVRSPWAWEIGCRPERRQFPLYVHAKIFATQNTLPFPKRGRDIWEDQQ